MQVRKIFYLVLCFCFVLSSCAKQPGSQPKSTSDVSTTKLETSEVFPSKLTHESTTISGYGTVADGDGEKHKIFVRPEWSFSEEYFECYYNPENSEELYHRENRYGIADKEGNIIIYPQFGFIRPVAKDRFLVGNGEKPENGEFEANEWAVISSNGEIIIPFTSNIQCIVDYYDGLESNYFCVSREKDNEYYLDNKRYYLADNNGNMVYDMCFEDFYVDNFPNNTKPIHKGYYDGEVYYFDKNLEIIKILNDKPVPDEHFSTYHNVEYSQTVCYKYGKYYYGVMNKTTGKEIVPCQYEEVTHLTKDRILASKTRGDDENTNIYVIYDFYGNVICPEEKYNTIEKVNFGDMGVYRSVGIASEYNPQGDRVDGEWYEWLIDKNGIKISDKYYHIYYNDYGEMAGYYTADRGDRVFYLDKNGKVVGTIGA